MFRPREIIFSATSLCNLRCKHCFVSRNVETYDIKHALNFVDDCAKNGIERVGFSGGELFLNLCFVCEICKKAVEKDLLFGRIMTNAVWWNSENELCDKLNLLLDSGFDGKITISLDKFHNQDIKKVAKFVEKAIKLGQSEDMISFAAVKTGGDGDEISKAMLKPFDEFVVDWIDYIPHDFDDAKYWNSERWFKDDYCKGPGNVFYVHSGGDISGCCGYANEEKELFLGNVTKDNYESLMKNAQNSEMYAIIYERGFEAEIRTLESESKILGKTDKHCLFCRKIIELKRVFV